MTPEICSSRRMTACSCWLSDTSTAREIRAKPSAVERALREDTWTLAECVARVLAVGDIGPGDVVQVSYGYGLFTGGLGAHDGAAKLGAIQLPTSSGNSEKQIMLMQDFGTTALCCTPSYALHLAECIEKSDTVKAENLKLRVGFFGAEPWTWGIRRELEKKLHIKAIDIYGLTEMSIITQVRLSR